MRRVFLPITCLLCLPFLGGCVFPYCCYPRLDYTPAVKVNGPHNEVRAFRVEISKDAADVCVEVGADGKMAPIPVWMTARCEMLSEVPVTQAACR